MYDTILFPTDGSDGAAAALDHARDLASLCGATVHVLHVVETAHGFGMVGDHQREDGPGMVGDHHGDDAYGMVGSQPTPEEARDELTEQAQEFVERTASEFDGVETTGTVRFGDPHRIILDYATDNDVDCIVMGTHGRTGLDRYLIGSVAERVVRLSDVPVVTVRGDEEATE